MPAGWHSDIYGRSQSAYGRVRLFIYLSPTSTHSGALYDPHRTIPCPSAGPSLWTPARAQMRLSLLRQEGSYRRKLLAAVLLLELVLDLDQRARQRRGALERRVVLMWTEKPRPVVGHSSDGGERDQGKQG